MESSYEIHCSMASFASILHSQVLKTDEQISSLKSTINSFALAENTKNTDSEKLENVPPSPNAEDAVIAALERERLSLIMDIQEQDFAQGKLNDMIKESSELIHAVSEFYKDLAPNGFNQDNSQRECVQPCTFSRETERLILANISKLEEVLSKICDSIKQSASLTQIEIFNKSEAQKQLHSLVDSLNEGFHSLSTVT